MKLGIRLISWAAECAESLLVPLGDRWLHVQGVVERARYVGEMFDGDDRCCLIAAAYLHDIGYASSLKKTGFHPLDGAYYIRSLGFDRLASLVAHHSESRFEAYLRGYESELDEFPCERSAMADALTYCDMTTNSLGVPVLLKERAADVFRRYGETDVVTQALLQSLPYVALAVAHTRQRLVQRELGVGVSE